uniref:Uncharacterized protein n=1 Tax=Arundo donax TaxID=35708 RepID=A0A0A8Z184_ARUDO
MHTPHWGDACMITYSELAVGNVQR